jgi:two-component system, OmpR family, sensor histidine kinase AdeS
MISSSLRSRVAILAALIALVATTACALLAAQALIAGVHSQRENAALAVAEQAQLRLNRLVLRLSFENGDYAVWDEMYQAMPQPGADWAAINLSPGSSQGRLTQAFVVIDTNGRIAGRFRRSSQHGSEPSPDDPAPTSAFTPMAIDRSHAGLAAPTGLPLLFAAHPILTSDGSGPSRGTLIAVAYMTPSIISDLVHSGFAIEVAPLTRPSPQPLVAWRNDRVAATVSVPTYDGHGVALTVVETGNVSNELVWRAVVAIAVGGLSAAAAAILIGIHLGWSWMRPLSALAEACRRRVDQPDAPLPKVTGLREAEVLHDALEHMDAAAREHARLLGEALDRERTVNAVHQRFLAQLAREIGDPIHALVGTIDRLAAEGGRLPPEEVAAARDRALELEARLQEVLGLVDGANEEATIRSGRRNIADYLSGVAELLRPLAQQRGGRVSATGDGSVHLRPDLMTPILVNLVSNPLRIRRDVSVRIHGKAENNFSIWTIEDDGPGIEPELAQRITDACARGEVLPGTPGIGLGLSIVLANLRALGGTITCSNTPDHGVRFDLHIPEPAGTGSQLLRLI